MPNTSDHQLGAAAAQSRIIRVRDLPIYYDTKIDETHRSISRINDEQQKPIDTNNHNSWLYSTVSQTRQAVQQAWNDNKDLRLRIARGLETGEAHAKTTLDYIRDDETLFPKVGVVTIAGLGGLLLGHRGGALRKTFYSSVAVAVALSACYPKQSSNLLDQVYLRIKNESRALIDKTASNPSSLPVTVEKKILESKDRILHAVKTEHEPTVVIKGDYGQGTPADQHLYTTRGTVNPTVVNTEKKL